MFFVAISSCYYEVISVDKVRLRSGATITINGAKLIIKRCSQCKLVFDGKYVCLARELSITLVFDGLKLPQFNFQIEKEDERHKHELEHQ